MDSSALGAGVSAGVSAVVGASVGAGVGAMQHPSDDGSLVGAGAAACAGSGISPSAQGVKYSGNKYSASPSSTSAQVQGLQHASYLSLSGGPKSTPLSSTSSSFLSTSGQYPSLHKPLSSRNSEHSVTPTWAHFPPAPKAIGPMKIRGAPGTLTTRCFTAPLFQSTNRPGATSTTRDAAHPSPAAASRPVNS